MTNHITYIRDNCMTFSLRANDEQQKKNRRNQININQMFNNS